MHLFYLDAPLDGVHLKLSREESNHAFQVLRLEKSMTVKVTNGKGALVDAVIENIDRKSCLVRVTDRKAIPEEREGKIHLAVAPTKSIDRFELFLEKVTEIGVDRITPITTEHSERRKVRHDRSLKVLIAAMKQSQRSWLPQLDELMPLKEFLKLDLPERKCFGYCDGTHANFMEWYDGTDTLALIGPEGDFSPGEAGMLQEVGFVPVSIGNTRLRTETAAIAACCWMSLSQQK